MGTPTSVSNILPVLLGSIGTLIPLVNKTFRLICLYRQLCNVFRPVRCEKLRNYTDTVPSTGINPYLNATLQLYGVLTGYTVR